MSKYSEFFLLSNAKHESIGDRLRLRKFGSWLAEESWTREEQSRKKAQFSLKVLHLARKVAKAKGISEDEAFNALQNQGEGSEEILAEYEEEVAQVMSALPSNREQMEELVTLFFKNRGEVLVGKKWQRTEDWDNGDTKMLTSTLLSDVESFMVREDLAVSSDQEEEEEEEDGPKEAF